MTNREFANSGSRQLIKILNQSFNRSRDIEQELKVNKYWSKQIKAELTRRGVKLEKTF